LFPSNMRWLAAPVGLLVIGILVGFYPVARYRLPRSSESWTHLANLETIPNAIDAANIPKMLDLFERRQHYAKYPLFYLVCKLLGVNTPEEAALFSASVFCVLPLLTFALARAQVGDLAGFFAGVLVGISPAFVYTMNFFSGGEPLALALLLVGMWVYLRRGPLHSLPVFAAVILVHPLTSLFLWFMILLLPFFTDRSAQSLPRTIFCTAGYSGLFLAWMLFQISEGLPLGGYITANLGTAPVSLLVLAPTLAAIALLAARDRRPRFEAMLSDVTARLRANLAWGVIVLEILLLLVLLVFDLPGTEQGLDPSLVAFYLPLLVEVSFTYFARDCLPPLGTVGTICFLLLLFGSLVVPRGVPAYRLAPYGALALALLLSPLIGRPRLRPVLFILVAALAFTAYPPPRYYFGFDEQYYPWEVDAASALIRTGTGGRILTDVRMEDLLTFYGAGDLLVTAEGPVDLTGRDMVFVTDQMRRYGLYPPGAEWYREPFQLDISPLDTDATRLYDSQRVGIYFLGGSEVRLAELGNR
jgi:hypothetical protein